MFWTSRLISLLGATPLTVAGCTSTIKVRHIDGPSRPVLHRLAEPIDASVGIVANEYVEAGHTKEPYVSNAREVCDGVASCLRAIGAFREIRYPANPSERLDHTFEIAAQFNVDANLGEARATGAVVGLTMGLAAPAARVRVVAHQRASVKMIQPTMGPLRHFRCSYEAKLNPFGSASASQAGLLCGQNMVQHTVDLVAHEIMDSYRKPQTAQPEPSLSVVRHHGRLQGRTDASVSAKRFSGKGRNVENSCR